MKAITKHKYGGPEVLKVEDIEKPVVKAGHLLVKVKANALNPADWHTLRGKPLLTRLAFGLFKPKNKVLGADFAGVVEEVSETTSNFKAGDHVFGEIKKGKAFAEYVLAPEPECAIMPTQSSFQEMAGVPLAGLTAYQSLITQGKLAKNETILINGSSGGVGHFAVQIAKAYGAKVTAVCSSKNKDFVKSLGADKVIAYDKEDIHTLNQKFDMVLDLHGNLNHVDYTRMGNRGVVVGFTTMKHLFSVLIRNGFSKFSLKQFTAKSNAEDLRVLASLIKENKLKTHIDKTFNFTATPEAIAYIEQMRTVGKVIINWKV